VAAARRALLVALRVIASFALFGQRILDYLHISLPALQGAGGLLLLIVALQLLTGSEGVPVGDRGADDRRLGDRVRQRRGRDLTPDGSTVEGRTTDAG